jgi:UDP-GlcNAc:undecaprenyl-phosphate/decaprenyl-phosphate GlcNAc-1-phosphate transferase
LWRRQSPLYGDYTHLHHRLLRRGFSQRTVLLMYYSISVVLGASAVMLQTRLKVVVLAGISVLFLLLIIVGSYVVRRNKTLC